MAAVNISIRNDPGFSGWYLGPTTTQALTDPVTWTTSKGYARGCSATGPCAYATRCADNSITYDDGETAACACRTMTIFQSQPYGTPSARNIFCAKDWVAFTVFHELSATTTSSTSTITTSTSPLSTTPPRVTASSTGPPEPNASPPASSNSKNTWIAGPVVGSIAAVATSAALGWFLYRRKQKQAPSSPQERFIDQSYLQTAVPMHEMDSANQNPIYELSSHTYK